jgi:outer membrane protein
MTCRRAMIALVAGLLARCLTAEDTTTTVSMAVAESVTTAATGFLAEPVLRAETPLRPDLTVASLDDLLTTPVLETIGSTVPENQRIVLPADALPPAEYALLSGTGRGTPLGVLEAVCRALERNQSLNVARLSPEISNTSIESARGEFDTTLNMSASAGERRSSNLGPLPKDRDDTFVRPEESITVSRNQDAAASLSGRLPTGTNYSVGVSINRSESNRREQFYTAEANVRITQNLLKGAGRDVNMIRVWTAQNNFVISLYQLQSTLINLVTDAQVAYWDLYLAMKTLEIRQKSFNVAKERRVQAEELLRVGRATPLDVLSAQAEESARVSDVISAGAQVKQRGLQLVRLLNPEGDPKGWQTVYYPTDSPKLPGEKVDARERVQLAMMLRPDLRQAQIDLANGELEVFRSADGLLPALDFIVEAGVTGLGDDFGDAERRLRHGDLSNWRTGLQFSIPLQNRSARAAYRRANFQRMQAEEAVKNFRQIIELDVRTAIIEIERTSRLIESTKVTSRLRREEYEAEVEKFKVGRSTQLLVNQALRDMTAAALDEVTAEVANIKAYLQLYKAEGSALQRVGVLPVMIGPGSGVETR